MLGCQLAFTAAASASRRDNSAFTQPTDKCVSSISCTHNPISRWLTPTSVNTSVLRTSRLRSTRTSFSAGRGPCGPGCMAAFNNVFPAAAML